MEKFYNYLFSNIECSSLNFFIPNYMDSLEFRNLLSLVISNYGLENYKKLVDSYNEQLEKEKEMGLLLTPLEIVNMYKDNSVNIVK